MMVLRYRSGILAGVECGVILYTLLSPFRLSTKPKKEANTGNKWQLAIEGFPAISFIKHTKRGFMAGFIQLCAFWANSKEPRAERGEGDRGAEAIAAGKVCWMRSLLNPPPRPAFFCAVSFVPLIIEILPVLLVYFFPNKLQQPLI